MHTTSHVDARRIAPPCPRTPALVAVSNERRGWLYVVQVDEDTEAAIVSIPGVEVDLEHERTWVSLNAAVALPDLFQIVHDPGGLSAAPGSPTSPCVTKIQRADGAGETTLRPHQVAGVAHLRQPLGAVLGDRVGVGKTLQAVAAAVQGGFEKVLVVGPLSAQPIWCGDRGDPKAVYGIDVHPLAGATPDLASLPETGWVFCHYDIVHEWFGALVSKFRPNLLIVDEAHRLRSPRIRAAKDVRNLAMLSTVRSRFVLTGTPETEGRGDLFSLLDIAQPGAFGTPHTYGVRYQAGYKGEYGFVYDGHSNDEEFFARVSRVLLARTRKDAGLPDIPVEILPVDVEIDAATRRVYDEARRDIRRHLRETVDDAAARVQGDHLRRITALCSILSTAKVPAAVATALDQVEDARKVVVYAWYQDSIARIAAGLRDAGVVVFGPITGDTTPRKRQKAAAGFAAAPGQAAFCATLAAASESINDLAVAHRMVQADLWWEPKPHLQAIGRVARGGQAHDVRVLFLRAADTIETHILSRLTAKAESSLRDGGGHEAHELVDALSPPKERESALSDLLQGLAALDEVSL